jgi:hypothetical protein
LGRVSGRIANAARATALFLPLREAYALSTWLEATSMGPAYTDQFASGAAVSAVQRMTAPESAESVAFWARRNVPPAGLNSGGATVPAIEYLPVIMELSRRPFMVAMALRVVVRSIFSAPVYRGDDDVGSEPSTV